ncbi:MAG TPA: ABC transporter permease, partial [Rhodanobacteraceae bacterium]|nr:ABC transporter permease [Rhodanobacteraceae bacterium]
EAMGDLGTSLLTAIHLIFHLNHDLVQIIVLTFQVNLVAAVLGCLVAFPLGAAVAVLRFPGRRVAIALLNAGMSLSGVVIGLVVYLMLSRSGPLGGWGLLFSPSAMVIAQWIMVTPIVAALTYQTVADCHQKYDEQLRSFGAGHLRMMFTLLWDVRFSLVTAALAGFGRALAEVGTVMIVGGNINHYTRVMTTAIALETTKGDLPLAMALGMILLGLTLIVTLLAEVVRGIAGRRYAYG